MNLQNLFHLLIISFILATGCKPEKEGEVKSENNGDAGYSDGVVVVEAEEFISASAEYAVKQGNVSYVYMNEPGWLAFDVQFTIPGRYRTEIHASSGNQEVAPSVWIEDYYDNNDGRTYDVSGDIPVNPTDEFSAYSVDGSPFNATRHAMKLHVKEGSVKLDKIVFRLLKKHQETPRVYQQNMQGREWELAWSDEFEGRQIDTSKWNFDIGDWGWGNNELQYYTENRTENARIENGCLIIEARKNDHGKKWTSARLTTRGKASFRYGKIEFRARVPREKGNWAAGWTLGDSYVDELDWPYCGEIDILESVGYEVNDDSGDGTAHATVHTPAYYFKINNQISSTLEVLNIAGEFHIYSVEWTPTEIRGYVDEEHYYTYDKNNNEKEWPFDIPQNIILNLAMGGGWGGAQGLDPSVNSQQFIIDYVRVYELK